ncbi:Coiled-coil domain containing protein 54 [Dissostichus eleginoides]|uniref:Coiled-coil domain containing protein 54 n=1 Tax=Dissostichus eleginoides TaxID=100907 RepID=A0AAD9FCK9_DISEL|nr:Coiled-coil domain containing protein 54 [Dissostichus eleginoides]
MSTLQGNNSASKECEGSSEANATTDNTDNATLQAINGLKTEFSSKLDGLLSAVNSVKSELTSCQKRISETEERISNAEDDVVSLQRRAESLEEQVAKLTSKLDSSENRSRISNLRLVNLPEAAEGKDICAFLESWLPDALRLAPPASPIAIERAHWLSGPKLANGPPRPLIMALNPQIDRSTGSDTKATSAGLKYIVQQENRPLSYLRTAWFLEQVDFVG